MLEGKLIYYAVFVFSLLVTGLALTIIEYKNIAKNDDVSSDVESLDSAQKKLKVIKI
jgi:outer membrane murein-binding lipoprotein Lpp